VEIGPARGGATGIATGKIHSLFESRDVRQRFETFVSACSLFRKKGLSDLLRPNYKRGADAADLPGD
jgi:hypothetical protein